jgi:hypothetical protein
MPGGPDACSRHPGSPMEGNKVYLILGDSVEWRVLRVMPHTHWSTEAWPQVGAEFMKAIALASRRCCGRLDAELDLLRASELN